MADGDARQPLTARAAIDAISRYLPNEWSQLTDDQVTVESISGGYVNTVNLVTRSTESILEPQQVIIHQSNGGIAVERGKGTPFATRFEELLVFYESSKMGTAPKLYGMSEELTVQEYVLSHTLTPEDCLDKNILTKLAQAYAKFHSINVPIDQTKYMENISVFIENCRKFLDSKEQIKQLAVKVIPSLDWEQVFALDFEAEFDWILKMFDQVGYRRVVITGDENYLNVLVAENGNRIAFIDYEMAKFEPRGLDLGSHLFNRTVKWNDKVNKASGYEILDEQLRRYFITQYCEESAKYIKDFDPNGLDSVDHVMEEAAVGILTYSLTWGGGMLFDIEKLLYIENGSFLTVIHHMLKSYIKLKEQLMQENPHWKSLTSED